ncbi:Cytochrome P450 [Cordyceps fumosorosea ARSEF 2679]|uniref:Cytochrome P450 n=1 Tax=Cordyceps fumosorosea (strain ARSEF 2679) TaxID=1081104 RepID=A0A168D2K2_CORFA|nr:Cytochrome P450 [Cordyceps fumosorosea ARSEF 2679]OAA72090.1 Cytochrome P450 [Cordyceps fumosorosea ARSEF 2679]
MDATDFDAWPFGLTILATLMALFVVKVALNRRRTNGLPLPPGPPAEPILGHLRIVPSHSPEYTYMQWSRQYGSDVLSVNILGQPVIVLNSVKAAVDLLDKRGHKYSDRPRFVLFEVMGWGKTLTFLRWGPDFRKHRRILQKSLSNSSIVQYRRMQERETAIMLKGLAANPAEWENVVRRLATAIVLGIGFGITIDSDKDPFIQVAADASYALGHGGAPAGTPVDFFPILRYMPRWLHDRSLKFANDWAWAIRNLHDKPFDAAVSTRRRTESIIQAMLDERQAQLGKGETPELELDDIKGAAGAVFAAGQDTTWATIMVFVINMILHPEIQAKAQQTLDQVVGRNRIPSFEDRQNPDLRYIEYLVQETLRWCPVSPIGIPHRSIEDDVYNGYFIPAGSFVYANARAMTHDLDIYLDPDEFDPERYTPVEEGGRGEPFPNGQFGFGRRVCVGQHLAKATVWIVVAGILSTMDVKKPLDDQGNEVTPKVELTNGLTSQPDGFDARFVLRDDMSLDLIRAL